MEPGIPKLDSLNALLLLINNHFGRPRRMAGSASCFGIMQRVAIQASDHGIYAFHVGHHLHLADISVTHLTFHAGVQMSLVTPFHAW